MTTSKMITVKKTTSDYTDQLVSLMTENAILTDLPLMTAKMLTPGNGGMKRSNINNMLQVFYHHHTEELLTWVTPSKDSFGLILVILDKV